jgi:hypothetical protein
MSDSEFTWDKQSAFNKLTSGMKFKVETPTPIVKVKKTFELTKPNDPEKDAYRKCSKCGKHYNFHKNGKCSK